MPIGYRVNVDVPRPEPALLARFADVRSTDVADVLYGAGTVDREIAPAYLPIRRIVGSALTVSVPSASEAMIKVALQAAARGDIVVVNAMGNRTSALVGSNMLRALRHRGAVGAIFDGVIRDVSELRAEDFPVFARGTVTAEGPYAPDAGEINFPIACGGVVVNPGDVVLADEDGIVVVPAASAETVLADVAELDAKHEAAQATLVQGNQTNYAAVEAALRASGCEFVGA